MNKRRILDRDKRIMSMGAEAYRNGKTVDENPFDYATEMLKHADWNFGWGKEKEFWENNNHMNLEL